MEGLRDPVPASLQRVLRRAVLQLVTHERRRRFPPVLHVGAPAGAEVDFGSEQALDHALDHALRADVVAAMVRHVGVVPDAEPPLVWLTRSGDLELADADAAWLAAARTAYAEACLPLTMVVVTRQGWRDPRTGTSRTWRRLRDRSRGAAD